MKRSRGRERKREAFVKPGSNGGIINIEQAYTLMCNITLNKIECRRCSCCFRFFFFCRLFVHSFIDSFIHSFHFFLFLFYSLYCCCNSAAAAASAVVDVVLTNLFTIRIECILCMHYRTYVLSVFLSFFHFFHNKFPSLWNHFRYLYISLRSGEGIQTVALQLMCERIDFRQCVTVWLCVCVYLFLFSLTETPLKL